MFFTANIAYPSTGATFCIVFFGNIAKTFIAQLLPEQCLTSVLHCLPLAFLHIMMAITNWILDAISFANVSCLLCNVSLELLLC